MKKLIWQAFSSAGSNYDPAVSKNSEHPLRTAVHFLYELKMIAPMGAGMGIYESGTFVSEVDLRDFLAELRAHIDTKISRIPFGSINRTHPYLGRVDRESFVVRKRTGQPWDHFSPICRGSIQNDTGRVTVKYRFSLLTRGWFCSWVFLFSTLTFAVGVVAIVLRDVRAGAVFDDWTGWLIGAALAAVSGCVMLAILQFARSVAEEDTAELRQLLQIAAESGE